MLLCTENWATLVWNQLNRWVRCRSAERRRMLYKKRWCRWAVRPFTIKLTQLAVFIRLIGRHQQDQNTTNGKRITRKWPLDLCSTANEVRAFRSVILFDVFDLIRVEKHIKICAWLVNGMLPARVKNLYFNELWKALASLSIICPKKFLQQSWEHLFLVQQPEAESIWRFSTWWKII